MTKLKHVADIIAGQSPASEDVRLMEGSRLPFLQGNAEFGTLTPSPRYECDVAAKVSIPGDVLLSVRAPVGAVNRSDRSYGLGRGLCAIRPRLIDGGYVWWWLHAVKPRLDALSTGSTFSAVTASDVGSLEVPDNHVDHQRKIAAFLDREVAKVDALVAEQEGLVEVLRERRSAVVARATGWAGEPPQHWREKRISWLFRTTGSGTTPSPEDMVDAAEGTVSWVTTGELRESIIRGSRKAVMPESISTYSALKVHPAGSLLIAMYGATIGRMGILGVAAASNQACCALVGPTGCVSEFVQYSLLAAREHLILDAAGGGQPNINQDKVRSFRIPVPLVDEQRQIVQYLDEQTTKIDALIAEAEGIVAVAKERRLALITAAVTGQIDVRGEVA